ncbi:hypothetical protein CLOP_g7120, partial [Closterium sp. NIES-67]
LGGEGRNDGGEKLGQRNEGLLEGTGVTGEVVEREGESGQRRWRKGRGRRKTNKKRKQRRRKKKRRRRRRRPAPTAATASTATAAIAATTAAAAAAAAVEGSLRERAGAAMDPVELLKSGGEAAGFDAAGRGDAPGGMGGVVLEVRNNNSSNSRNSRSSSGDSSSKRPPPPSGAGTRVLKDQNQGSTAGPSAAVNAAASAGDHDADASAAPHSDTSASAPAPPAAAAAARCSSSSGSTPPPRLASAMQASLGALIVSAGAVPCLLSVVREQDSKSMLADDCVLLLSSLASVREGQEAIVESGGIAVLGRVLEDGTMLGRENAGAALLLLAKAEAEWLRAIVAEAVLPALIEVVDGVGQSSRARTKAQELLNLVRGAQRRSFTVLDKVKQQLKSNPQYTVQIDTSTPAASSGVSSPAYPPRAAH